ncbi:hypothetical protein LJ737_19465, partial [Hymenobacter sp. 15J16-1T3B]|uniref:hypothetical protein n=1 Tax=Hymenobacter sp. 15J16-1T3B TaxID=2886941 RepID=UPI001D109330
MKTTSKQAGVSEHDQGEVDQKLRAVEDYLLTRYQMRYNVVKEVVEWRPAGSAAPYRLLDDYQL